MTLAQNKTSLFLSGTNTSPPMNMPENAGSGKSRSAAQSEKLSILIICSNKDSCLLYKTVLELWNYKVQTTDSEADLSNLSNSFSPNVILFDLSINYKENLKTMSEMRQTSLFRAVPFILISGFTQNDVKEEAFINGASDYLVKPIDFEVLRQSLIARLKENLSSLKSDGL